MTGPIMSAARAFPPTAKPPNGNARSVVSLTAAQCSERMVLPGNGSAESIEPRGSAAGVVAHFPGRAVRCEPLRDGAARKPEHTDERLAGGGARIVDARRARIPRYARK